MWFELESRRKSQTAQMGRPLFRCGSSWAGDLATRVRFVAPFRRDPMPIDARRGGVEEKIRQEMEEAKKENSRVAEARLKGRRRVRGEGKRPRAPMNSRREAEPGRPGAGPPANNTKIRVHGLRSTRRGLTIGSKTTLCPGARPTPSPRHCIQAAFESPLARARNRRGESSPASACSSQDAGVLPGPAFAPAFPSTHGATGRILPSIGDRRPPPFAKRELLLIRAPPSRV